jgi:hypothetical protein
VAKILSARRARVRKKKRCNAEKYSKVTNVEDVKRDENKATDARNIERLLHLFPVYLLYKLIPFFGSVNKQALIPSTSQREQFIAVFIELGAQQCE